MTTTSFVLNPTDPDCPPVRITLTEVAGGDIQVTIDVITSGGLIGDIRALYFDVNEELIGTLAATGAYVTTVEQGDDSVTNVGNTGEIKPNDGGFDFGVEIGTPGIGTDDLQSATFILSSSLRDLTLADVLISGQEYGVRLTSVGAIGGARSDSCKILDEPAFGEVEVCKYEDVNGNGVVDAGDVIKTGWTFGIDIDGDGVIDLSKTDGADGDVADGCVTFDGLTVGTNYTIYEGSMAGWYATGDTVQSGTIGESGESDTVNFTNARYGEVEVCKYEDVNGNGVVDAGDIIKTGWTFGIDIDGDGVIDLSKTDGADGDVADGCVTFDGLTVGTNYTIYEGSMAGWYATGDTVQSGTIGESGESDSLDFTNARYGEVEACKWWDKTGDGPSADDVKIGGWTFGIDLDGDGIIDLSKTDGADGDVEDGCVTFDGLTIGTDYTVYENTREGWVPIIGGDGLSGTISQSGEQDSLDFYNFKEDCLEGLTPGFWRQAQNWEKVTLDADCVDFWIGLGVDDVHGDGLDFADIFASNVTFGEVFGVSDFTYRQGRSNITVDADLTLLQAVSLEGGGDAGALIRHATAAIMNACAEEVNYAFTKGEIIDDVQDAWGNISAMGALKNEIEAMNELGLEEDDGFECLFLTGLSVIDPVAVL